MQSTISIDAKSPKELYFESVEKVQDENMKMALKSLYDFGFTNFGVNNMLMLKHQDVNTVANTLMSGALSESQFGAMYNWVHAYQFAQNKRDERRDVCLQND